jgi:hypothetical protein
MQELTYIIEEDHDRESNTFSYGVTIYKDGEMLDDYTEWFDTENRAYFYAQHCMTNVTA